MKIINWNINSVKSRIKHLMSILQNESYDIVMLQELKCEKHQFPELIIENLGYNHALSCQKTYNGVAIFSKFRIEEIKTSFPGQPNEEEARFIETSIVINKKFYRVICVYVPNGAEVDSDKFKFKLEFLNSLNAYINSIITSDERLLIGGDFNVALSPIDVFDHNSLNGTLCYTPIERQILQSFLNNNKLHDCYRQLNPAQHQYSWWDYRKNSFTNNKGLRKDYLFANSLLMDEIIDCKINIEIRQLEKTSDHAPVIAEFA